MEAMVSVGAKVAVIKPAMTEIGADAKGPTHRTAMNACNREGGERPPDDSMGLRDSGRDTVKGEGQRSEEQRRSDEKFLHEDVPP
jgi:hypothetical protein